MDLSATWLWLIAGLILCGAEMLVGTFYLLVLGLGSLAGALCAWLGAPLAWQCTAFAVVTVIGGFMVRKLRIRKNDEADALQNLDVGQTVTVDDWSADGTASVQYRGTQWQVVAQSEADRKPGLCRIVRVDGSRLVVTHM